MIGVGTGLPTWGTLFKSQVPSPTERRGQMMLPAVVVRLAVLVLVVVVILMMVMTATVALTMLTMVHYHIAITCAF